MSGAVTLTLKDTVEGRVVADSIVPDRFAALSAMEIAHLTGLVDTPHRAAGARRRDGLRHGPSGT